MPLQSLIEDHFKAVGWPTQGAAGEPKGHAGLGDRSRAVAFALTKRSHWHSAQLVGTLTAG
eukprot:15463700-Alexandrium_andersonii.AAC.1